MNKPQAIGGALLLALATTLVACSGDSSAPEATETTTPARQEVGSAATAAPIVLLAAPSLPDLALLNQDGDEVLVEELRGKPTLITFIYTRCPMPEMCPATTLRFQQVQKALTPEQRESVTLISVSFDPFDTPEVLAEYGDLWEVDTSFWTLLTGAEEDVHGLASSYGVWYEKSDEDETFRHPMYSMILLSDGSLHQVLLGSTFDADEVARTLLSLANDSGSMAR